MGITTVASRNRRAYLFLGMAMAISVVIAFPIEQVTREGYAPGACSDAAIGLNIGNIVQALLTPLLIFMWPGPGSIQQKKSKAATPLRATPQTSASSASDLGKFDPRQPNIWRRSAGFMGSGCLCAAAVSLAWWYLLRAYGPVRQSCPALYDLSLPAHRYKPDYVLDFYHYYIYLSLFAAFWTGITAGALRTQSARTSESARGDASQHFETFYWTCFLGWAVQYRLSQWFATPKTNQDWVSLSCLGFTFVIVSSLCVLPFIRPMWNKRPRNWWMAVVAAFGRSLLIYLLTLLCFLWLVVYALLPLVPPLVTWNVFGFTWAVVIGTRRWRVLQERQAQMMAS
jgi:hypothetical protein